MTHRIRTIPHHATTALAALAALTMLVLVAAMGASSPAGATSGETDPPASDAADTEPDAAPETDYARMVLVLDASGSMAEPAGGGTTKIDAARQALGTVVDGLPDEAYVGLRVYGATVFSRDQKGACTDSQLIVDPGTDNRDELRAALESYEPYGETPIGYALRQAAGDIGGESTRSIVLVSDGIATCEPDPCVVAGELAQQGIDLQIDVVGLSVDAKARAQLRCVAAKGNGTYYDADDADEIVASLETAADRAVRPFALDGTPLAGGGSDDPTPIEAGLWSDKVGTTPQDSERWFSYTRTMPGSTVRVGLSSLGGDPDEWDTVQLETSTPLGDSCGVDNSFKNVNSAELLGAEVAVGEPQSNEDCVTSDEVLIMVSRSLSNMGRGQSPFSLQVVEEPPADGTSLAEEGSWSGIVLDPPDVSGTPEAVTGGDSFATAPVLTDGVYKGTIVPGETQAFRVQLAYGQQLSARLRTPPASPALHEQIGHQGPFASFLVYSPMRGNVPISGEGINTHGFAATSSSGVFGVQTPEVRYNNRVSSVTVGTSLPGYYYLVFAADSDHRGESYEMPYRLELEVRGEESGAPEYAEGQALLTGTDAPLGAPISAPAEPDEPSDDGADDPADDSGQAAPKDEAEPLSAGTLAAAGALAAVALGCVAVAVNLLRGRRG
ncbi:VWA domain-containing protein [Nocardioides sp. zg-1228]|uniref:vWA domain-containing protein n=1 Tax=Nocardioides sp. zg-1228 TaxID=2763008 RepID=UPI0016436A7A|nr:VWA domain-containing protein [Nocardioides sp. zg-1228]MBC2931594.1 VWA domain-containing protein [Nocardioides sp. zg-1228]QSF57191.1 VWA domain-containing protein [Nocardioides sp. zg-1228]